MSGLQTESTERQKSTRALKTISEAADLLDVPQHVLRFWETKFSQIKPLKRNGGRRFYRPDDIETLMKIKFLLYRQGYTIKGAKKVFDDKNRDAIFERLSYQQGVMNGSSVMNDNMPGVQPVLASDQHEVSASGKPSKEIEEIIESLKELSKELRGE